MSRNSLGSAQRRTGVRRVVASRNFSLANNLSNYDLFLDHSAIVQIHEP